MKYLIFIFYCLVSGSLSAQCITTEPVNASTCQGTNQTASFSLSAPTATAFTWQLQNNTTSAWSNVSNGANYSGGTTADLTISGLNATAGSSSYRCLVADAAGACDTSVVVVFTVKPKPVLQTSVAASSVCSGSPLSIALTNTLGSAGATYSWSRSVVTGITPNSSNGTSNSISETLSNSTDASINVSYSITTTTNQCVSNAVSVTIEIKPRPNISNINAPIDLCSGDSFSGTLNFPSGSIIPTGTTYSWTVPSSTNITGEANGSGSAFSTSNLSHSQSTAQQLTYTLAPTAAGCQANTSFTVTLNVKPRPSIANINTPIDLCSGDSFSGTLNFPSGSITPTGTTYSWTVPSSTNITGEANGSGSNFSTSSLSHSQSTAQQLTYTLAPTAAGCQANSSFTVTLNIKPRPSIANINTPIDLCSGDSFNGTLNFPSGFIIPTGTNYSWTVTNSTTITGESIGSGSAFSTSNLSHNQSTAQQLTYNLTPTAAGCQANNSFTVVLNVKPRPSIVSPATVQICSGESHSTNFSTVPNAIVPIGTVFTWSVSNSPSISGENSNNTPATSFSTGTLSHSQNTTPTALSYTISASADGCPANASFNLSVQVKPLPAITTKNIEICSNIPISLSPTNGNGDVVPSGTTYSWPAPSSILTGMASGTNQNSFNQTLENTSGADQSISYSLIPTANSCSGAAFTVNLTIKFEPTPNIIGTQTICPGESVQLYVDGGASYLWSSNPLNAGINFPFINNPTVNPNATTTYSVVVTGANNCSTSRSVTVNVSNLPSISNLQSATSSICSGSTFSFSPNVASGITYTWTRVNNGSYSSNAGFGSANISHVIFNELSNPTAVTYDFNLVNAEGCTNVQSLSVVVHPLPAISNVQDFPQSLCSGMAFGFSPETPSNSTFNWSRSTVSGVSTSSGAIGSTSISNHSFLNNTNTEKWMVYQFTLSSPAGCNSSEELGFWLQPNVVLNNNTNTTLTGICSGTELNYFPNVSNGLNDVTLFWSRSALPNGLVSSSNGQGQGMMSDILVNNTNASISSVYVLTGYYNGCSSSPVNVTVPILPIPVLIANAGSNVCSGAALNTGLLSSITTGQNSFSWNAAASAGVSLTSGSLSGTSSSFNHTWSNLSNQVGQVTYSGQVSNGGCTSELMTWSVDIKPLPVLTNLPTNQTVCSGEVWTYEPQWSSANTTYSWTRTTPSNLTGSSVINHSLINGSNTQSVSANYTITGNSLGCTSAVSNFNVSINPLPVPNSDVNFNFCHGEIPNIVLTDWSALNVHWTPEFWFENADASATLFIGDNSGVAQVSASNSFGCSVSSSVEIVLHEMLNANVIFTGTYCAGDILIMTPENSTYNAYTWLVDGDEVGVGNSISFNPEQDFEISLVATDDNNCSQESQYYLDIHELPVNVIQGADSHCQNQMNVGFQSDNPQDASWIWSADNATIIAGEQSAQAYFNLGIGDYCTIYLQTTDEYGCVFSDTLLVELSGLADSTVQLGLIGNATLVHPDSTYGEYRWGKTSIGEGVEESVFSGYQYFNFQILDLTQYYYWVETYTDEGCSTRSYYNAPQFPIGVEDIGEQHFQLYPNPTSDGWLTLIGGENVQMQLYNSFGVLVQQGKVNGRLDLSQLESGLYYAVLSKEGFSETIKIVKL
jgi:hypothetical protein